MNIYLWDLYKGAMFQQRLMTCGSEYSVLVDPLLHDITTEQLNKLVTQNNPRMAARFTRTCVDETTGRITTFGCINFFMKATIANMMFFEFSDDFLPLDNFSN